MNLKLRLKLFDIIKQLFGGGAIIYTICLAMAIYSATQKDVEAATIFLVIMVIRKQWD